MADCSDGVAAPETTARDGVPVWYGGGKLAPDLSWPKLRQRWAPGRATSGRVRPDLTAQERNAVWEHATRVAADARVEVDDKAEFLRARCWDAGHGYKILSCLRKRSPRTGG